MKKKWKVILLILIVVLVGASTIMNFPYALMDSHDNIYANDTRIIEKSDTYSYMLKEGGNEANKTLLNFELTGMETLWEIEASEDTIVEIDYKSKVEAGDVKLVLISEDDDMQIFFEGEGNGKSALEIKKGLNRIKIVAKKAKAKVEFEILEKEELQIISRD